MDRQRRVSCAALTAALCLAMGSATAESWKVGTGLDYTSGKYGGDKDIATVYAPLNVRYRADRFGVRVTVPYLRVDGPGSVIDDQGQLIPGPDRTESGLGDVILGATLYDVISLPQQSFYVDLTAKVKFGTADADRGLGTGETDYAMQGDWYKDVERIGLFGTIGYKFYGDPQGLDLQNAAFASIGGDFRIVGSARMGIIYDYRESSIDGNDALQEMTLFTTFSSGGFSFQPYVLTGLSDSSPDWGIGLMMNVKTRSR